MLAGQMLNVINCSRPQRCCKGLDILGIAQSVDVGLRDPPLVLAHTCPEQVSAGDDVVHAHGLT